MLMYFAHAHATLLVQAREIYSTEYLCAKNIVWGKCGKTGICRCTQQTNCVDTPECPPTTTLEHQQQQRQAQRDSDGEFEHMGQKVLVGPLIGARRHRR